MRCLIRNKSRFYYANSLGLTEIKDEQGRLTGEYETAYSEPIEMLANISASKGETESLQFGDSLAYDKVLVIDNPDIAIDEYSVLWVDRLDISKPYDYIVKKVAKSLNSVSIAISRVDVNE